MTARTELGQVGAAGRAGVASPEVGAAELAPAVDRHVDQLVEALRSPATGLATAQRWGRLLAVPLLAGLADEALCVAGADTSVVQEVHLVAIHTLCDALDTEIAVVMAP